MHNNHITHKVALITGAARRIGAAIATTLHNAGMRIVLHYHTSAKEASELCQTLNERRAHSAIAIQTDLMAIANLELLVEQAATQWGRLDVLVNNASRFYPTLVGQTTEQAWDDLLINNLKAPFFLCQAAAPHLSATQGCIVNIGDTHATKALSKHPVYCISKAGLLMLTRTLAKDLAPHVRVNSVSPGAVMWPEGENALSEELKQRIREQIPLAHEGKPEDIAETVLYVVRDAGYMTGQNIVVDGGRGLV